MKELKESLEKAGLTGNESIVYLELLQRDEISAYDLSKKISMDRTLIYQLLNSLADKGLASFVQKNNKKYFKATSPKHLLNPVKEKEIFVQDLIKKLEGMGKKQDVHSEIRVYEGKQGLRNMLKTLLENEELCSFGATGRAYDYLYELPRLTKEFNRIKGDRRIIFAKKYKDHEIKKLKSLKSKYLDVDSE
ncbi:MAG: TrmB family transcriptional regulator, partial [Candidatus Woesearchaeota archaeon]